MMRQKPADFFPPSFSIRSFFVALSSVILVSTTGYAKANELPSPSKQKPLSWFHPFVILTGGVAAAKTGHSQTITREGDFTIYQYTSDHSHSNRMLWGGSLGTEIPLASQWDLQLGIGFYRPNDFSGSGILLQGIDEQSTDEFAYNYKVKTSQLFFEGKLLHSIKEIFHPYVSLGLGAAFNKASDYEVEVPPFLTFTPEFEDHNTSNFAYSLGLGMDLDLGKHWRLGIGYRYVGLGDADFGRGTLDDLPFTPTLTSGHLYLQEGIVQVSYLI
ncbi:outer membrane beta-barrel protein [Fluoribacter dumoffii]|uniref:Opacity protein and related surface antigens n=1 Tax=Fluoribacter dumoffii TaxID=463 RepID=A0A377GCV5_9GAMM|nr:outer membrane beta-barrel protein [Fluoribacter dumoffii]KTC90489.1 hypothetical protein Ldum_1557 [Fluoribacter dumoffii NY 23]MCW8386168.1 outer membrane beta-barrel protein [Fluoribacter dumoffii]MCW8419219.1 outer membrane beta-barrel protein [Fluoribacter dumoffii]MCW8452906.1 outer membrane beta-barrel protein [Fluoribacter dumoffii]MCW8459844.1 outer membrane beta-barrel protein [Fluoribacter dumoffii]